LHKIIFNPITMRVNGNKLTGQEYKVFQLLLSMPGIVSYDALKKVLGVDENKQYAVDQFIVPRVWVGRVRAKIATDDTRYSIIESVTNIGYRLNAEVKIVLRENQLSWQKPRLIRYKWNLKKAKLRYGHLFEGEANEKNRQKLEDRYGITRVSMAFRDARPIQTNS